MTRLNLLIASLEFLDDLACSIGWHAWFGGAKDLRTTRYCATCGRTVTLPGARWEREA